MFMSTQLDRPIIFSKSRTARKSNWKNDESFMKNRNSNGFQFEYDNFEDFGIKNTLEQMKSENVWYNQQHDTVHYQKIWYRFDQLQRWIRGAPKIFVLLIQENFQKFSKFVLLIQAIFCEKFPKFSRIANVALNPYFSNFRRLRRRKFVLLILKIPDFL